jgi:hypothetical protein
MPIECGVPKTVFADTCYGTKAVRPITGNLPGRFASLTEVGNDPFPDDALPTPSLVREKVQFSGA